MDGLIRTLVIICASVFLLTYLSLFAVIMGVIMKERRNERENRTGSRGV